ncbi:hypothetical protein J132_04547 [Termitomyces sp. J132]|nr:hypothetical protein J132_04547 [Termitomyces sp. J132]
MADPGMDIMLYWTPGHTGIPGNKRVDRETKMVAEGEDTSMGGLPFLRKLLKMSKAMVLATHKAQWQKEAEDRI